MYTAKQIARWFIEELNVESGEVMTPLKLQKLLYYAQAWSLALFENPLFDERLEAWAHGPVVPSIFQSLKEYRYHPISLDEFDDEDTDFDPRTTQLLEEINSVYGKYDAKYLEALTHQENPWIKTREGYAPEERCNEEITHDLMASYYREMQAENGD